MAGVLSGAMMIEKWSTYLEREIKQHERDLVLAEGKIQENKELLERIKHSCLYCGERIHSYGEGTKEMDRHMANSHPEEWHVSQELSVIHSEA